MFGAILLGIGGIVGAVVAGILFEEQLAQKKEATAGYKRNFLRPVFALLASLGCFLTSGREAYVAGIGIPLHQTALSDHRIYEQVPDPTLVFLRDQENNVQAFHLEEPPPSPVFKVLPGPVGTSKKQLVPYPPQPEKTSTEKEGK